MSSDDCLPGPLKDFIFDLHDSVRTSQMPAEQLTLYTGSFRDLTSKYFEKSAWPSPEAVSDECGGDEVFLAIYKELTQRHLHSISRPSVRDRIQGWKVYQNLFDLLIAQGENTKENNSGFAPLLLLPEWAFDILHEFLYQFQGFCQFRTGVFTNASKYGPGGISEGKNPPNHTTDNLDVLSKNKDAWAVEKVMFYLSRLVAIGTNPETTPAPAYQYLAIFASVTLSRLECLLGDHTSSLNALAPINKSFIVEPPRGSESDVKAMNAEEIVDSVFAAKVSVTYHAGVSYLMLRRYKDAAKVLGDMCATMRRGFKSGTYKKIVGVEQFTKLYDRMIALLAIITHACPSYGLVDDSVSNAVRERHGVQLSKIEAGEEGYEDLFIYACPKFISPAVPAYEDALTKESTSAHDAAYKLQVNHFMNEMSNQQTMMKLRSYMKLYTSISVEKLGRLVKEEDFEALLLSYKQKTRQVECSDVDGGDEGEVRGSVMDIHYFIKDGIIHVDEAEKQNRFESYFMSQISQSSDIMKDVESISVEI
jgi:translation initiation factor 3 subunit L